jgi:hypothetical protein
MRVVAICDGVGFCDAGFLPWHVVAHVQEVDGLYGKFTQVLKLHDNDKVGTFLRGHTRFLDLFLSQCNQPKGGNTITQQLRRL